MIFRRKYVEELEDQIRDSIERQLGQGCSYSAIQGPTTHYATHSLTQMSNYVLPYNAKKNCDNCGATYKPGEKKCEYCGGER